MEIPSHRRNMFDESGSLLGFTVWQFTHLAGALPPFEDLRIETREAEAHFEREITLEKVTLDDYEVSHSLRGL